MDVIRVISLLWLLTCIAAGSKIIVLLPVASTSHKNVFSPVVEALASRGHQLTVVSPIKPKKDVPNIKEVVLPQAMAGFMSQIQKSIFDDSNSFQVSNFGTLGKMIADSCEHLFNDTTIKSYLKEDKPFDVAIVSQFFNDCGTSTAYLLAKHVVHLSSGSHFPWIPTQMLSPPSYVPNPTNTYTDHMSFWERAKNFLSIVSFQMLYRFFIQPISQELLKKYVPGAPSIEEAYANISLTILNMDPVYFSPRPSMPNVIHIGAAHGRPAQPLPKAYGQLVDYWNTGCEDKGRNITLTGVTITRQKLYASGLNEFSEFIDSSGEDGFIMFSLGSVAQSQFMPGVIRDAFLSAFKRLKQKVIWKYEDDLQDIPENVKVTKWLPQQDLLGHPKIRLFLTHGGLLSVEEALYHAVPVIGIPLFGDQPGNIVRVKQLGIGEGLDRRNITADGVFDTVNRVLNDQSYKANMKNYSRILHDQPQTSLDRAVFWIEYVIRHDGARHFRSSGADLNVVQFYLLDVVAFIFVAAFVTILLVVLLIKVSVRRLGSSTKKKED